MRIFTLVFVLGLITNINLHAKKVNGKILFEDDTIDVIFIIPVDMISQDINFEQLQQRVKYIDNKGKKHKLRPDDAKEIRFKYQYSEIRMLSRPNTIDLGDIFFSNKNIFLKLEIDGYLKLFNYYYKQKQNVSNNYNDLSGFNFGAYSTNNVEFEYSFERFILQKGDSELKRPKNISFKKDMIEYFQDCPDLVEKIENKEIKKDYLELAVRFYNSKCGKR